MVIAELSRGEIPHKVVIDVVRRLEKGQVLILPTDTVYGLHCHARNLDAVEKIRKIKGIVEDRPFSVIYSTVLNIQRWVHLPEGRDRSLIVNSWPGAVTWVLPSTRHVPRHLLGSEDSLGIRIPSHPFLRAVSTAMDDLIISTSANKHGSPPCISGADLDTDLIEIVDAVILENEPLRGNPSEVKIWTPAGPVVLRARLSEAREKKERLNILVVCSGNLCRSPMTAHILAERLKEEAPGKFTVRSAGTAAKEGQRASLQAAESMRLHGIDLSNHRSRSVNEELMEWADIVLAMTADHLGDLHSQFPDYTHKVYLFTTYPDSELEGQYGIEDPFGMDQEFYNQTADTILTHMDRIVSHLLQKI